MKFERSKENIRTDKELLSLLGVRGARTSKSFDENSPIERFEEREREEGRISRKIPSPGGDSSKTRGP